MAGLSIRKLPQTLFIGGVEVSKEKFENPADQCSGPSPVTQELGRRRVCRAAPISFGHPIHGWHSERNIYLSNLEPKDYSGRPKKLNTHRVPLGITFFHPSGVSAPDRPYYNQDVKVDKVLPEAGVDQFGQ